MMPTHMRQGLLILMLGLIAASSFRALAQEQATPTPTAENNQISAVAWSPDGNLIAAGSRNGQITLSDASGQEILTLSDHTSWVSDLAWSTYATRLASVSVDRTLKLWDTATGSLLRTTVLADEYATAVIWTPDNSEIITASSNEKGHLFSWDANTGALVSWFEAGSVVQMRWSPDYTLLAMANPGGGIALRDAKTLQFIRFIDGGEMGGHGYDDYSLAWKADSSQVTSGKLNGMLRIWDVAQGKIIATLPASRLEELNFTTSRITAVTYRNNDTELLGVRADGAMYLWNAVTGDVLTTTKLKSAAYAAAFSPDGSKLAYGREGTSVQIVSVSDLLTTPTAAPP